MSNFIKLFAFVGILIGCLGLYGLVSFVCARRTKEVSIRKILGATLSNILVLLSKDFLILLTVAFVIAIPIGWFAMDRFLQEYTYKIEIDWTVFAWAGSLTMTLALLTIVLKSVRTVLINPAETLKYE
jgi:predicted lysophospholipase L1 biosynthesis ABC-type transport system permease subunit